MALSFVVSAAPGWMSPDSFDMYLQARSQRYSDWHSPLLTYAWSFAIPEKLGPVIPFVLQNALFWCGVFMVFSFLRTRVGFWALFLPVILIQSQFTWVVAWLWKDAFEMAFVSLCVGFLSRAVDAKTTKSSNLFEILAVLSLGAVSFARIYLAPVLVVLTIAIHILVRQIRKDTQTKAPIGLGISLAVVLSTMAGGYLIETFVVKPITAGGASSTMLLDIARVQCENPGKQTVQIPAEYINRGTGDICENYNPVNWDPLMWPTEKGHTGLKIPEGSPNNNLRETWIEGLLKSPGHYVEGRLKLFAANLIAYDFVAPELRFENQLKPSSFGFGESLGFPNFQDNSFLYVFLKFPLALTNDTALHWALSSSIIFIVVLPVLTLLVVQRKRKKYSGELHFPILSVPLLWAANMAVLVPSVGLRYLAPAALLSVLLSAFVIGLTVNGKNLKPRLA